MTDDGQLIDRIVRDVMQQLQTSTDTLPPNDAGGSENSSGDENSTASESLRLDQKVITEKTLQQLVNGQRRIDVATQSVLTPSAHDFLRSRGIEVGRISQVTNGPLSKNHWKAFVPCTTLVVETAIHEVNSWANVCIAVELVGTIPDAVESAVGALSRAEVVGAVVLTAEPETVACLANRNRLVRAAAVENVQSAKDARQRIGANLFSINPAAKTYFELRNILRAMTASGSPRVPENWHE